MAGENLHKKNKNNFFKNMTITFDLISLVELVQNDPNNIHTTQRLPATEEPSSVISARVGPLESNLHNSGVLEMKEAEKIGFGQFPNSNSFVIWKMN